MRILIILLILMPVSAFSQKSDFGNWLIYFGNKQINPKLNWHHEVQYRNFNLVGDLDQLLLRTGLGCNLSENNNNLLLGYGYIYNESYLAQTQLKTYFDEHRVYQQFITRQQFGRLTLQHRYRFEQRFFAADFRMRFRYFLAANFALNRSEMTDKTLYLSTYNEVFLNTESIIFDRNRLYVGLGYRFSPKLRTEFGVMNQSTNLVSRNQLNLVMFVNF